MLNVSTKHKLALKQYHYIVSIMTSQSQASEY